MLNVSRNARKYQLSLYHTENTGSSPVENPIVNYLKLNSLLRLRDYYTTNVFHQCLA